VLDRVKELVQERTACPPSAARIAEEVALVAESEARADGWWSGKAPVVKVGLVCRASSLASGDCPAVAFLAHGVGVGNLRQIRWKPCVS
jgi:hypothetical protein